ncbi:SusC/RagA family TonB-linked outer membrane protein [Salinibacter ruber]|uniref:SusC/RagA family TonB-linked outer membrane protein n=1 Tax=Salinibacter ruber TaxID=146919 RepID=UPI0021694F66
MLWKKALLSFVLLSMCGVSSAIAQTGTVTGVVTETSSGDALPGANVVIVDSQRGTSTDADGAFRIPGLEPGTYQVRASFVGFRSRTQEVDVEPNETLELNFILSPDAMAMDEMVVVGYGTQERSDLTGSISSVPTEDLAETPIESAQEAIQGRVSGVTVTQNTGSPGSGFSIRIRGTGTTGNSNPLYVVDGVPVSDPTETGAGGISFLNPNDIESIDILKGASAAAIYGAQAANGAVIITTKSGSAGERSVSFSAYTGIQQTPRTIDMLEGPEYAALRNEANINAGQAPTFTSPSAYLGPEGSTDYQDLVFERGITQNYSLAVSGGTEDLTYRISGGYFEEGGIIDKSSLERLNARVNTEFEVNDLLTVGENLTFERRTRSTISESDNVRNLLIQTLQVDPTVPARDSAGNFTAQPRTNANNPLAALDFRNNEYNENRLVGNVFAELSFLPSLRVRSQLGFDLRNGNTYAFTPEYDISPSFRNVSPSTTQYSDFQSSLIWDNTLTFDKAFGSHDVEAVGGTTIETNYYRFINATTQGQPGNDPSLRYLGAGPEVVNIGGSLAESNLLSFFGRLNYNFSDRYLLTAVARYDGSSRFGANNRFAFFPSVSAAWRISEEPFFPDNELVTNLKLRAGWGQNGNQRIGDYPFAATIAGNQDYVLNGQLAPGSAPLQSPNPNVKWEETTQTDIGLDAALFGDRLNLSAGFYNKVTSDLLVYLPPIPTSGLVSASPENAGEIRNRGWEFSADYSVTPAEDLTVRVGGNLTTLSNEVVSLAQSTDFVINSGNYRNGSITRTEPGHPVGAFYGYKTDGLFQTPEEVANANELSDEGPYQSADTAPGDIRFEDLNGDGQITQADQTFIGNPTPDFTYGFNLDVEYKGVSLSTLFQGVQGNDLFAAYKFYTVFNTAFNMSEAVKNRWTGPGTSTRMPRLTSSDPNQNSRISDFYVEDGSYLRLKNVRLGYSVPSRLLSSLGAGLDRARLYVSAKNLFTLTGYDGYTPEIGVNNSTLDRGIDRATYPQPRVYTVGINLGF